MKKLRSVIAILLCALLLPALPVLRSAAYDGEIFVNAPEAYAGQLGISEDALASLVRFFYDSVDVCRRELNLSPYNISNTQTNVEIIRDLIMENPKSFNVTGVRYSTSGGAIRTFYLVFKNDLETYRAQLAECDAVAAELTDGITPDMPDYVKALLLHDRLAAYCSYSMDYHYDTGRYDDDDYNAYGALVGRKAVCQGYTNAYAYLLNYVGINSYSCASDELAHVWNIVIIDGVKYHVDVTWDDPLMDVPGRVGHWNVLSSSDKLYNSYPTAHYANDYDVSPDSSLYDVAAWSGSQAQVCLLNGMLYYVDNAAKCICSYDFVTGTTQAICDLSAAYWPASATSHWTDCYTRLDSDGEFLYYSLPDGVYRFDPVAQYGEAVFLPDMSGHAFFSVYGFDLCGRTITCLAAATPNLRETTPTEVYVYSLGGEYTEPVVSNVEQGGVYEGPVVISWDAGEATLDGVPFENGGEVTEPGEHVLVVVNGDKTVTVSFTVGQAEPPQKKGDVDGDNAITVADALSVLRVAARLAPATPEILAVGDVDGDGVITVADALAILRVAAKLVASL